MSCNPAKYFATDYGILCRKVLLEGRKFSAAVPHRAPGATPPRITTRVLLAPPRPWCDTAQNYDACPAGPIWSRPIFSRRPSASAGKPSPGQPSRRSFRYSAGSSSSKQDGAAPRVAGEFYRRAIGCHRFPLALSMGGLKRIWVDYAG